MTDTHTYIQGVFFTGPALKVLSMEMVPPKKEIDWFCHKSSKYGTGPTQEKKVTGSAQHIEKCFAFNKIIRLIKIYGKNLKVQATHRIFFFDSIILT